MSGDRVQGDGRARLIAIAVHDLRNPLASILGNAEYLIQARELSPDSREAVGDLLSAARLLARVLGEVRAIDRAFDGELRVDSDDVELGALVRELVGAMAPRARLAEVELRSRVDGEVTARGDRELLRQLVEELLDASLRVAPPGSAVEIDAARGDAITLVVRDRRPPPDAEELAGMFEVGAARRIGPLFCRVACETQGGRIRAGVEPDGAFATVATLPRGG